MQAQQQRCAARVTGQARALRAGVDGDRLAVLPFGLPPIGIGRSGRQRNQRGQQQHHAGRQTARVVLARDRAVGVGPGVVQAQLQVFAQADGVLRDGKVAFAVARPTARFSGQATPDPASRQVALPLQVAAAGRYEARGTLYATARDGQLKPVAQAHAAAWFDGPGAGQLVLPFDQAALPAGFGAPYELRDLQLQDQSRMAPIESRALALQF
ncbi:hypothetical protein G6F32_014210 [Rhizopus arrhizus]|nr:hypothetical protein G6F32_014210 [Rhizopus arrhizus]